MALRESCLAGQALGTYFTYHAQSFAHAEKRLTAQGFSSYDSDAVDLWVICRRSERKGKACRKLVDLVFHRRPVLFGRKTLRIPELARVFGDWRAEMDRREQILKGLAGGDKSLFEKFQEAMA